MSPRRNIVYSLEQLNSKRFTTNCLFAAPESPCYFGKRCDNVDIECLKCKYTFPYSNCGRSSLEVSAELACALGGLQAGIPKRHPPPIPVTPPYIPQVAADLILSGAVNDCKWASIGFDEARTHGYRNKDDVRRGLRLRRNTRYVLNCSVDECAIEGILVGDALVDYIVGLRPSIGSRPKSWWKFRLGATVLEPEPSGMLCRVHVNVKH
jgi:hypothetical protein